MIRKYFLILLETLLQFGQLYSEQILQNKLGKIGARMPYLSDGDRLARMSEEI